MHIAIVEDEAAIFAQFREYITRYSKESGKCIDLTHYCNGIEFLNHFKGQFDIILAEFAAALQWQIHCFLWSESNPPLWQKYDLLILVYALVFPVMYLLGRKNAAPVQVASGELLTVAMIGICVFAIRNLSFYFHDTPFSGQYASEIMNIRTFADLGGLAILFAYHQHRAHMYAQRELDAMQTVLENQYAQYRMSRDSMELIDRKHHDLKHQIHALRSEQNPAVRNQWLDEMEADIRSYEAQNKTGNSVLDTVLTGKSLYCQKHGITLSVIADGSRLQFMDVMDICTIFGNALDNAIECELKIQDKSMWAIHLPLTTQKQFLLLVENYCPEAPKFQGGLPVSTKGDPAFHGFGVKSIQHTARKYGGTTTFGVEEGWFVLKVLIPLSHLEKRTELVRNFCTKRHVKPEVIPENLPFMQENDCLCALALEKIFPVLQ